MDTEGVLRAALLQLSEEDDLALHLLHADVVVFYAREVLLHLVQLVVVGGKERAGNGGTEFCVTDTGIGIRKEDQDKVFDRFYKADGFKPGFGLGLTLCHKSAGLLGGTLELDKKYTKGARFVLVLPNAF